MAAGLLPAVGMGAKRHSTSGNKKARLRGLFVLLTVRF
jgi:hypothetical protein